MVPCPIFLNLQMYAQLLQSGEFAFFLETMEEMMWGIGQYNQKLSHIICDSIFGGKEKSWFEAYKSKCMPALDYSYLILDEDLDRLHTMDEIEIYNKRLKAFLPACSASRQSTYTSRPRKSISRKLFSTAP